MAAQTKTGLRKIRFFEATNNYMKPEGKHLNQSGSIGVI